VAENMPAMKRRDTAFLLIGLGIGLELAVIELYAILSSQLHVRVPWGQGILFDGPFLLILLGITMAWREWIEKTEPRPSTD
jgi:hypothetical protein